MNETSKPLLPVRHGLLLATVLALLTVAALTGLSPTARRELVAVVLVAAGTVYVGMAIAGTGRRVVIVESAFFLVTGALALGGLWISLYLLPIGLAAHGIWDLGRRLPNRSGPAPAWYAYSCAVYDFIVAGACLVLLR